MCNVNVDMDVRYISLAQCSLTDALVSIEPPGRICGSRLTCSRAVNVCRSFMMFVQVAMPFHAKISQAPKNDDEVDLLW
jgi:hypothetical protein